MRVGQPSPSRIDGSFSGVPNELRVMLMARWSLCYRVQMRIHFVWECMSECRIENRGDKNEKEVTKKGWRKGYRLGNAHVT